MTARLAFFIFLFFFQAEDGIRDTSVTGVQTCALPIFGLGGVFSYFVAGRKAPLFTRLGWLSGINSLLVILALARILAQGDHPSNWDLEIGRASCRERV